MPNTTDMFADTFKTMTEGFADAMRNTMKFNEDTARFWTDTLTRNTDEFRTRTQRFVDEMTPFSRQSAERMQKNFDEQMQRTVNFVRDSAQAFQPARTDLNERLFSMWKDSLENARETLETCTKANMDIARTWTEFFNTAASSAAGTVNRTAAAAQASQGKSQKGSN